MANIDGRLRVFDTQVAERLEPRDLVGNRLFQIGVAILTARFAIRTTVVAGLFRK